ncbi:MAG: EF-hand domain-containing protein [Actinomycetota bacterium]|nr:EF-hand domain-containing protein [Actinomycetota bacterium]
MGATDEARQGFDSIDVDGDGYITASELLKEFVKDNPKVSDDNIVAIIQMADDDGNQRIPTKNTRNS